MRPEDILLEQTVGLHTQAIPFIRQEVPRKYFLTPDGLLVAPYVQAVGETLRKKFGINPVHAKDKDAGWQRAIDAGFTAKIWITLSDARVRSLHHKRHKEFRPIQERFSVQIEGSTPPMYPRDEAAALSDIINCRCLLAFALA